MNRVVAATMAAGLVVASSAAGAPTAETRSAAEVVARNVAARGSLDAWRKVETMVWIGHIESAHAPAPSMPFQLQQRRPNKTRLQIDSPGGRSVRVFDGVRGWKARPSRGRPQAEPYTLQELRFAQGGHGLDGPLLDASARGVPVTLEGVEELGGRPAYHLSVHPATGDSEHVWVDTQTFLEIRVDRMADGPAGTQRRVSTTYGDYRTVEGLQVPFLIETGGEPGTPPDKMKLQTVMLNAPLDDSVFSNPAAPHRRHRVRPGAAPRALTPTASSSGSTAAASAPAAASEGGAAPP